MTIGWPPEVNQNMEQGSYQEKPEDVVVSFQPKYGPDIRKPGTIMPSSMMSYSTILTAEEVSAMEIFYRDVLSCGSRKFRRKHPRTRADGNFRFDSPPSYSALKNGVKFRAAIALRQVP